jgi:hypothetical protein
MTVTFRARVERAPSSATAATIRLVLGTVGGAALGVTARAWMRLVSDHPEFSWSGTVSIVIGFAVFGMLQGVAAIGRTRRRPWARRATRLAGVVGLLPLFVGAGGVMLPTVVGGGLALVRDDWPRRARALAGAVALAPVAFVAASLVHEGGRSLRVAAGTAGLVGLYATIAVVARPTFAPPPVPHRALRWAAGVALALLSVAFAFATVGAQGP